MRRQQYNELLKRIPSPTSIPEFNTEGRLIICLVEFRIMDEIEQVINAVLRVYEPHEIGLSIVYGTQNASYIESLYGEWKNIVLVNTGHGNLNRGTYSALLKQPQLYEHFTRWSNVLIYQTDALLIRKIDDIYFQYDYIGSPWTEKNRCAKYCAGNGGFSLRKVDSMIRVCEQFRTLPFEKLPRGNEDIFFCSHKSFHYPPIDSILHQSFAVERVRNMNPVGCHQLYHGWCFSNEEYAEILQYIEDNLINNKKTVSNIQSLKTMTNVDTKKMPMVQVTNKTYKMYDMASNFKKNVNMLRRSVKSRPKTPVQQITNKNEQASGESNQVYKAEKKKYIYKRVPHELQKYQEFGPFRVFLKHQVKNNWVINCRNDYEILFCRNEDPDTVVESHKIDKKHEALIHKREQGCKYIDDGEYFYITFYPGYPDGGGPWADVHAPWGNHFQKGKNIPINGSDIKS